MRCRSTARTRTSRVVVIVDGVADDDVENGTYRAVAAVVVMLSALVIDDDDDDEAADDGDTPRHDAMMCNARACAIDSDSIAVRERTVSDCSSIILIEQEAGDICELYQVIRSPR
jgi:hypothetical protein